MIFTKPYSIAMALASFVVNSNAFSPAMRRRGHSIIAPSFIRSSSAMKASAIGYDDLQAGDILVWSTGTSAIEKLVALLSGDEYSHAAFVSGNAPNVFEQAGGIPVREHDFSSDESRAGRITTVTRFEGIDVAAVLSIAQAEVEAKVPYNLDNLAYLGAMLILKDPSVLYNAPDTFNDGMGELFSALKNSSRPEDESTFCSEFVYKCFYEAGIEFKIEDPVLDRVASAPSIISLVIDACDGDIPDEDFEKRFGTMDRSMAIQDSDEDFEKRFGTMAGTMTRSMAIQDFVAAADDDTETALNDAAGNLLKILEGKNKMVSSDEIAMIAGIPASINEKLIQDVIDFALRTEGITLPKGLSYKEQVQEVLKKVDSKMLVTPGELTRIINENATKLGSFVC